MIDKFLLDTRGYDVVRGAISPDLVRAANEAVDRLDVWERVAETVRGGSGFGWTETTDDVVRFACQMGPGHIQVGPVASWPASVSDLLVCPAVNVVLDQLFPEGHYVDHASLTLATHGSVGIELHGGAHERDLRQGYHMAGGDWSIGLSIIAIALTSHEGRSGGTALVPGTHKANFSPASPQPCPEDFDKTEWIVGVPLEPGDLLCFPEALMHGAFPWSHDWERRMLIIKAYPAHLSNWNGQQRSALEPFWPPSPIR